ncbi:MAG: RNA polymerase factor sigma-54 [Phycisphaerae bacterium]|jgi:RNA polymerase sigma-54 factor
MSQFLSQVARQLLQQQQRLTPQLIQAMDILQLNALALESRINQELDNNPALEVVAPDDETPEPAGDAAAPEPPADAAEANEWREREESLVVRAGDARDFERLDSLVREYDWLEDDGEYRGTRSRAARMEDSDAKLDAMANTTARPQRLRELLLEQWALLDMDDNTRRLGAAIIDQLDDVGRLPVALEEIAARFDPPPPVSKLEDALARVQLLDPPGIAARDLQECLLLQLEAMPGDTELARQIIEEQFENLQKNRLPVIARNLNVSMDELKAALRVISRLSMHPGSDVSDQGAPPVVPDVIVDYDPERGEYQVRLARANQRELRIAPEFREALEKAREDKTARDFLRQKIDAAATLIDAVRFRRQRLLEVAKAVVQAQREFLDKGEQHLRVLRMSELAERFGCDPSTISRTVDEKWVQTPRGIYPLRKFFTGGFASDNGEALGWDSIRAKVQEIVDREDKSDPLNDDEIVSRLSAQGVDISRRTVAKYRAQLAIPPARQRKQY